MTKVDTGGKDLTDYFCHIIGLRDDNDKFVNEGQKSMINELKEKICEVAEDYDSQVKKCLDSKIVETHTLPDGSKVKISGSMNKHLSPLKNVTKISKKIYSKMSFYVEVLVFL